jgi:hypothetical protein
VPKGSEPVSGSAGPGVAGFEIVVRDPLRGVNGVEKGASVVASGDPGIAIVSDSGYDLPRPAWQLSDLSVIAVGRLRSDRVADRRPVDLVERMQLGQQHSVETDPHPGLAPAAESPPARDATGISKLCRTTFSIDDT